VLSGTLKRFVRTSRPPKLLRPPASQNIIRASICRLSEFPLMGRQTREPSIRILPVTGTPDVVYYHLLPDAVEILAVFHGAPRRFSD
jgi:plasmid stabilization system protein ParE